MLESLLEKILLLQGSYVVHFDEDILSILWIVRVTLEE